MRASVRLGRIAGIRVGLNFSVLVIVVIITVALAVGQFPAVFPGRSVALYVVSALGAAVLFLASLLAHEMAHAVVARRNGIEVEGIVLWLFGGVAELKTEARSPGADFRVAVVGPLMSMALALLFGGVATALAAGGTMSLAAGVFAYLAVANALLAVFNLFPAAPLDGGRILRAALWAWRHDRSRASFIAARAGRAFGYLLVVLGMVQVVSGWGYGGLWLALIGLFVVNAAAAEEQGSRLSKALEGIRVGEVMTANPITADGHQPLNQFVTETVWSQRHSTYPLVDREGRLTGLATLDGIRDAPDERRGQLRLADVARSPDEVPTSTPDEPLTELLPRMAGTSDGRVVVVDGQRRVVGIVSPSDVNRAQELRKLRHWGRYDGLRGLSARPR